MKNLNRTEIIRLLIKSYSDVRESDLRNFSRVHENAYQQFVGLLDSEYHRETYEELNKQWYIMFRKNSNLKTRASSSRMPGFCVFERSVKIDIFDSLNEIKVYIPLDIEHIEDGVFKIFKFLADNNIDHHSKVRNGEISRDDVVVRLYSENDARKLIDFVNNDEFFKTNKIEPNPFSIRDGRVALSSDGLFSYNDFVRNIIYIFIKENNIYYFYQYIITEQDFIDWFKNYYEETFVKTNKSNLHDLFEKCKEGNNNIFSSTSVAYTNLKQMADILLMNLDSSKTVDDYFEYYSDITNEELYRHSVELMNNKIKGFKEDYDAHDTLKNQTITYEEAIERLNHYFKQYDIYNGDIEFRNEKPVNGLVLPSVVNGDVNLGWLKDADGVTFPKKIDGTLSLRGLKHANGLLLPEEVKILMLDSLEDAEGIVFPKEVDEIYFSSIKDLSSLKSLGHVKTLHIMGERESAENLVLPDNIEFLELMSDSVEGLILPSGIKGLQLSPYDYTGFTIPDGMDYIGLNFVYYFDDIELPSNLRELHLDCIFTDEIVLPDCVRNYECVSFGEEIEELEKIVVPNGTTLKFDKQYDIEIEYYEPHFEHENRHKQL